MPVYTDMIKDLIIQSKLNKQLLNEVSNKFYYNEINLSDVKNNHECRVKKHYGNDYIYPYFDGTQLINSLFSCIVIPIEYLKGKKYNSEKLRNENKEAYDRCLKIIGRLHFDYNYSERLENDVYKFFIHLRNALSHSGNGQINFFPNTENGRDITYIYFYDEQNPIGYNKYSNDKNYFLVKMHIIDDLIPLVDSFNDIILAINNDHPYGLEHIKKQIKKLSNKDILW